MNNDSYKFYRTSSSTRPRSSVEESERYSNEEDTFANNLSELFETHKFSPTIASKQKETLKEKLCEASSHNQSVRQIQTCCQRVFSQRGQTARSRDTLQEGISHYEQKIDRLMQFLLKKNFQGGDLLDKLSRCKQILLDFQSEYLSWGKIDTDKYADLLAKNSVIEHITAQINREIVNELEVHFDLEEPPPLVQGRLLPLEEESFPVAVREKMEEKKLLFLSELLMKDYIPQPWKEDQTLLQKTFGWICNPLVKKVVHWTDKALGIYKGCKDILQMKDQLLNYLQEHRLAILEEMQEVIDALPNGEERNQLEKWNTFVSHAFSSEIGREREEKWQKVREKWERGKLPQTDLSYALLEKRESLLQKIKGMGKENWFWQRDRRSLGTLEKILREKSPFSPSSDSSLQKEALIKELVEKYPGIEKLLEEFSELEESLSLQFSTSVKQEWATRMRDVEARLENAVVGEAKATNRILTLRTELIRSTFKRAPKEWKKGDRTLFREIRKRMVENIHLSEAELNSLLSEGTPTLRNFFADQKWLHSLLPWNKWEALLNQHSSDSIASALESLEFPEDFKEQAQQILFSRETRVALQRDLDFTSSHREEVLKKVFNRLLEGHHLLPMLSQHFSEDLLKKFSQKISQTLQEGLERGLLDLLLKTHYTSTGQEAEMFLSEKVEREKKELGEYAKQNPQKINLIKDTLKKLFKKIPLVRGMKNTAYKMAMGDTMSAYLYRASEEKWDYLSGDQFQRDLMRQASEFVLGKFVPEEEKRERRASTSLTLLEKISHYITERAFKQISPFLLSKALEGKILHHLERAIGGDV